MAEIVPFPSDSLSAQDVEDIIRLLPGWHIETGTDEGDLYAAAQRRFGEEPVLITRIAMTREYAALRDGDVIAEARTLAEVMAAVVEW